MSKIAACVLIINEENKVLGTSRRGKPDVWGLPGGKADPNETSEEAALRELKEETGVVGDKNDLIFLYAADCYGFMSTTYLLKKYEGLPQQVEDDISVEWIDWDKLMSGAFSEYNTNLKNAYDKMRNKDL